MVQRLEIFIDGKKSKEENKQNPKIYQELK